MKLAVWASVLLTFGLAGRGYPFSAAPAHTTTNRQTGGRSVASPAASGPPIVFYQCGPPATDGGVTCKNDDGSVEVDLTPISTRVRFSVINSRDHSETPIYVPGLAGNWARILIPPGDSGSFGGMSLHCQPQRGRHLRRQLVLLNPSSKLGPLNPIARL